MSSFIHMGGYAAYVWSCVGLGIAALAWNVVAARRLHAKARSQALSRAAARGSR